MEIAAPRRFPGRVWNELVHRYRPARWVDEWWYERARIPCELGSHLLGALALVGGAALGAPGFLVVAAGWLASNLDEIHTFYLALRHRDINLFDKAQTWERQRDGRLVYSPDAEEVRPAPGSFGGRIARVCSDFWTEKRRLPGFIFGVGAWLAGLVMGSVFHAPTLAVTAVVYGSMALQNAPVAFNALLSAVNGTWDHLNRPQTVNRENRRLRRRRDRPGTDGVEPAVNAASGFGVADAAAVHAPPSPLRRSLTRRMPGTGVRQVCMAGNVTVNVASPSPSASVRRQVGEVFL